MTCPRCWHWPSASKQTPLGTAIAESRYAFPIIEGVHLIGLSISVGLLFFTDLRLMGVLFRKVPLHDVLRQLRPWVLGGFAVIFALRRAAVSRRSARCWSTSPAFAFKLVFIALAGLNALYFEFVIARAAGAGERRACCRAA